MTRKELTELLEQELNAFFEELCRQFEGYELPQKMLADLRKKRLTQVPRIREMLSQSTASEADRNTEARLLAATIVGNLSMYSIYPYTKEQLNQCIRILAGSNKPVEVQKTTERLNKIARDMPQFYRNCIRSEGMYPLAVVLMTALQDCFAETSKQQKKAAKGSVQSKHEILCDLVTYLRGESVLGIGQKPDLREYEDAVRQYFSHTARIYLLHAAKNCAEDWSDTQYNLIMRDQFRKNTELFRKAAKLLPKQKPVGMPFAVTSDIKGKLPQITSAFDPRNPKAMLERDDPFLERMKELGIRDPEILGQIRKNRDEATALMEANQDAYASVHEAYMEGIKRQIAEEEELHWEIDTIAACESVLDAIVCDDEILNLNGMKSLLNWLRSKSPLPISFQNVLKLEDDEENADEYSDAWVEDAPGENGKLALTLVEDDSLLYQVFEKGNMSLKAPVSLAAVLSNYGERQLETPFEIRKSIIKAFREAGYSERKARDFAVMIATMQMVNRQEEWQYFRNDVFHTDSPVQEVPDQSSIDAQIQRMIGEEAKKRARAEKDSQSCRHENAVLRRKIEELNEALRQKDAEIQKREQLIELYEQMEEPGETAEAPEIQFPYRTDKRIVLYGGFDSFQADIQKLLPDLRIIAHCAHPDFAPLRKADFVFLQINRTSHSNYWRAVEVAKNSGAATHHLNNASPRVCAETIVRVLENRKPED